MMEKLNIKPLFIGDGKVDLEDFVKFAGYWLEGTAP